MSFCTNCGARVEGGQKFCTNCGNSLEFVELPALEVMLDMADDPAQPQQQAAQQPYSQPGFQQPPAQQQYQQPQPAQQPYQQPGQQPYQQPQPAQQPQHDSFIPDAQELREAIDSGSIWWAILGFIIPLVGIILYFVWHNTKPQTAKMSLLGAVVGICVGLILRFMF